MNIRRYESKYTKISFEKVPRGVISVETRIQALQNKLMLNMDKAVLLANKNTIRNKQGYTVLKQDE